MILHHIEDVHYWPYPDITYRQVCEIFGINTKPYGYVKFGMEPQNPIGELGLGDYKKMRSILRKADQTHVYIWDQDEAL